MKMFIDQVGPIFMVLAMLVVFLVVGLAAAEIGRLNLALKRAKDNKYAENRQNYAKFEFQKLFLGIRKHMDAKGHDRCWLNDLELYQLVDPKYDRMRMELPCLPEFLNNCCIYWRDSQPPEARKLGG